MALPTRPLRKNPPLPPSAAPKKQFEIKPWTGEGEGEKIGIYADSGMGKTTLAAMAPKPVFLGLDDGGRCIRHPVSGEPLNAIPGIETFQDVRDVLHSFDLLDSHSTVVIDTVTVLQDMAIPFILETVPSEKGVKMSNIVKYGYNKGYQHLYDAMKLILQDCDALVKRGKNIVFIAQAGPHKVPNPSGEDYLRSGPRLYSSSPSIEALYCEWLDHVFLIDYNLKAVEKKKAVSGEDRVIYTKGQVHFRAKSRTLTDEQSLVSFEHPGDDSIWQFIFAKN